MPPASVHSPIPAPVTRWPKMPVRTRPVFMGLAREKVVFPILNLLSSGNFLPPASQLGFYEATKTCLRAGLVYRQGEQAAMILPASLKMESSQPTTSPQSRPLSP